MMFSFTRNKYLQFGDVKEVDFKMKNGWRLFALTALLAISGCLSIITVQHSFAIPVCTGVQVTSVTGSIAPSNTGWSITINGCGFGSTYTTANTYADGTVTTAPSATTGSIVLVDQSSSGGIVRWSAGFGGDNIGIKITSWSPTQIVISGFGGLCSSPNCPGGVSETPNADQYPISVGDKIFIYLVGGDCTATGWSTYSGSTPPGYSLWPTSCQPVSAYINANPPSDPNEWGIPVLVQTPSTGVPEFPLGSLAMIAMIAAVLPAAYALRARIAGRRSGVAL